MTTATHPATPTHADEHASPAACAATNVSEGERWASTIGGALLALYGVTGRGTFENLVLPAIGGMLIYRGLTGHCHLYGALGVDTAEKHGERTSVEAGRGFKIEKSVIVDRPPQELYRFWRDLSQLPQIMSNLEEVRELDARRSHWKAKLALGTTAEWDAEIINDRPNELIAWRSVEGSQVDNAGSVRFVPAPGKRGTEVHVELRYSPPGGPIGAAIAWLFGESADQQVYDDLRAFKQVIETGEVVISDGTLGQRGYWQRPAQPPAELPAGWPVG